MRVYAKDDFISTRIKAGFRASDLAAKVEVNRQTIYGIEKGVHGLSPQLAKKICTALDAEFDDVFQLVEK